MISRAIILLAILVSLGTTFIVLAQYPLSKNIVLSSVFLTLGITLIISGITSTFFEFFAQKNLIEEMSKKIDEKLKSPPQNVSLGESRNSLHYRFLFESAGQELDIMGLTLPDITETGILPLFRDLIDKNGLRCRILIIDPLSDCAKIRSSYPQYGYSESIFEVSSSTIKRLYLFGKKLREVNINSDRFDVRLYDKLPLGLIITQNSIILSVYILDTMGQHAPFIKFTGESRNSRFCVSLREHFNKVWDSSRSIVDLPDAEIEELIKKLKNKHN